MNDLTILLGLFALMGNKYLIAEAFKFRHERIILEVLTILLELLPNTGKSERLETSGAGCSKPTTSLVNVSLRFQTFISHKRQYFFVEKM